MIGLLKAIHIYSKNTHCHPIWLVVVAAAEKFCMVTMRQYIIRAIMKFLLDRVVVTVRMKMELVIKEAIPVAAIALAVIVAVLLVLVLVLVVAVGVWIVVVVVAVVVVMVLILVTVVGVVVAVVMMSLEVQVQIAFTMQMEVIVKNTHIHRHPTHRQLPPALLLCTRPTLRHWVLMKYTQSNYCRYLINIIGFDY
jgi:hypothetical protein